MEYEYELRRLQIDAYLAMPWKHKLAVLQLKLKNYDKLRSWDIIDDYEQHFLIALIKICRRKSIPFLDSDGSYPELEKELDNFHAKYMNGVKFRFRHLERSSPTIWRETLWALGTIKETRKFLGIFRIPREILHKFFIC